MNKELLRMQKLAGIITESQYKQLLEDMEVVNRILDKISSQGKDSLTPEEQEYLDKYSTGKTNLNNPFPLSDNEIEKLYTKYPELEYSNFEGRKFLEDESDEDVEVYKINIDGKEYKVKANTITGEEKWYII